MQSTLNKIVGRDYSPKLLIIDDDPNALDLADYYLSGVALEILHASSGHEGLRIAQASSPDTILLDIDMPGMDGFQVCKHLKENNATRDIPVLKITRVVISPRRSTTAVWTT